MAAALIGDRFESEDLQVDGGGLLKRTQVHPQLGLQYLGKHELWAELEKAAARLAVHLHQGLRCKKEDKKMLLCTTVVSLWQRPMRLDIMRNEIVTLKNNKKSCFKFNII